MDKRGGIRWLLAGLLVAAMAMLVACRTRDPPAEPVASPEATAGVPVVRAGVELLAMPDAGAGPLVRAIDGARESIRLKIYLMTDDLVLEALQRAAARGVDVRVLIEEEPFGGGESNRVAEEAMQAAGIQVRATPRTFQYSHEKSLVVDGQQAFIMTHNLTLSSFNRNREYAVIVDDPAVVGEVMQVFDADWERQEPDLQQSLLVWSPTNSRQRIQALLDSARVSLELEQTSMLDEQIVDHLLAAAARGVRVRLITPAVFDPSEWEFEPISRLHAGGVAIRFLDEPYVHAKTILVDGQLALVGSQNMTDTSLELNRELGIVFDDAAAVNRLASYFLQDWNSAEPWTGPQPTATLPSGGVVDWQDTAGYLGQTVTVEGDVVDTYDSGKVTFLNFDDDRTFTVVIFADDYAKFDVPPEDQYWRKRVRVTGQVTLYDQRPEMVVEGPDQIEIVADLLAHASEPTATLPASGIVDWQDAGQYLGQRITVEGDVVRSYNSGNAAFLNFAEDYQGSFSVVIFASDFNRWAEPPDQVYLGQRVQVSGKVKEYQGAPEMVVESPDQIAVLGPAEAQVSPTSTPPPTVPWEQAAGYEGQEVTVEGVVVDTYKSDKVIFLNFSPNRDDLKAVIFQQSWDQWPESPDELFMGRRLRVTGEVQLYEGAPEIIVRTASQVQVVE